VFVLAEVGEQQPLLRHKQPSWRRLIAPWEQADQDRDIVKRTDQFNRVGCCHSKVLHGDSTHELIHDPTSLAEDASHQLR
jgi:hypothetical protein